MKASLEIPLAFHGDSKNCTGDGKNHVSDSIRVEMSRKPGRWAIGYAADDFTRWRQCQGRNYFAARCWKTFLFAPFTAGGPIWWTSRRCSSLEQVSSPSFPFSRLDYFRMFRSSGSPSPRCSNKAIFFSNGKKKYRKDQIKSSPFRQTTRNQRSNSQTKPIPIE